MAKAVVDDLEAIEVEVQGGEAAASPLPVVVQPLPELLDKRSPVEQSGQRVARTGVQHHVARHRAGRDVGERAGDTHAPARGALRHDGAAECPAIRAVLVAKAMLVLDPFGLTTRQRLYRLAQPSHIIRVDAVEPLIWSHPALSGREAEHLPPARRDKHRARGHVEFPDAVVRALGGQREAVGGLAQRLLRHRLPRDVEPHEHQAVGVWQDGDVQQPGAGNRSERHLRQGARGAGAQRVLGRHRKVRGRQHRYRVGDPPALCARSRAVHQARQRIVPLADVPVIVEQAHAVVG